MTYFLPRFSTSNAEPNNIILDSSPNVNVEVVAKVVELRRHGKTHGKVCEEPNRLGYRTRTGKPWRHPQQIIKLLRSFDGA